QTARMPASAPCPYTTLFRSVLAPAAIDLPDRLRIGLDFPRHPRFRPRVEDDRGRERDVVADDLPPRASHVGAGLEPRRRATGTRDRKSTRLNSSHVKSSHAG